MVNALSRKQVNRTNERKNRWKWSTATTGPPSTPAPPPPTDSRLNIVSGQESFTFDFRAILIPILVGATSFPGLAMSKLYLLSILVILMASAFAAPSADEKAAKKDHPGSFQYLTSNFLGKVGLNLLLGLLYNLFQLKNCSLGLWVLGHSSQ